MRERADVVGWFERMVGVIHPAVNVPQVQSRRSRDSLACFGGWLLGCVALAPSRGGTAAAARAPCPSRSAVCRGGSAGLVGWHDANQWWLAGLEKVTERLPAETLAALAQELEETPRGRLRVRERVVGPAVWDVQLAAEPLQADGVAEVEQLGGQP